jgi:hypothetical protein
VVSRARFADIGAEATAVAAAGTAVDDKTIAFQ